VSFEAAAGRIVGIRKGDNPGKSVALVAVEPVPACERCLRGRGCGAGLLFRSGAAEIAIPVPEKLQLAPGDSVELRLPAAALLRAACMAYGMPLAGLLLAAAAAALAGSGDLAVAVVSAAGLLGGSLAARGLASRSCARPLRALELVAPAATAGREA